MDTRFDEAMPL